MLQLCCHMMMRGPGSRRELCPDADRPRCTGVHLRGCGLLNLLLHRAERRELGCGRQRQRPRGCLLDLLLALPQDLRTRTVSDAGDVQTWRGKIRASSCGTRHARRARCKPTGLCRAMACERTCVALGAASLTAFSAFLKKACTAGALGAGAAFMAVLAFKLAPRNSVRMANTMASNRIPRRSRLSLRLPYQISPAQDRVV